MSVLSRFLKEYNELYHEMYLEESTSDILNGIRQVEKIMNSPKFHPTSGLKSFYKTLKEQYKKPIKILLLGNQGLDKIAFINSILKDSIIPLNNALAQKKFTIKHSNIPFVQIAYKSSKDMPSKDSIFSNSLHSLDLSQSHLDLIESFEIFVPSSFLQGFEILKDMDGFKQDNAPCIKEADICIWLLEFKSKITQSENIAKILKKKPTIAILTKTHKIADSHELLEQISNEKHNLNKKFKLFSIHAISFKYFLAENKINDKFALFKNLALLEKQLNANKIKHIDQAIAFLENNKKDMESNLADDSNKYESQQNTIKAIEESILKMTQGAKAKRDYLIIKELLEKNKTIDLHYKILFEHYKSLDLLYHKESRALMAKAAKLNIACNKEIFGNILRSFKSYLESIVDSIIDNIEEVKVRTRPNNASFLDNITNKRIVFSTFKINIDEVSKELDDRQSILARKHKSLSVKISRFDSHINNSVEDSLSAFEGVIDEWIRKGHHLVLQKKPSFISMVGYFSLEEFNISVYRMLTKRHYEIMREFSDKIHTDLTVLNVWVQATKKMILECVVSRLKDKLNADRMLAKNGKAHEIEPITRTHVVDAILEILPSEIKDMFCLLPSSQTQFDYIPDLLLIETKENEKLIRYRIKEIIELRQTMKVGTKLLEEIIVEVKSTL